MVSVPTYYANFEPFSLILSYKRDSVFGGKFLFYLIQIFYEFVEEQAHVSQSH